MQGEHAATALENNLSNLESRLDAILAALEAKEDPQLPAAAIVSKREDSSKVKGTDDPKDELPDGTAGDAVKAGKDTA
ncbi:Ff.00g127840.m01.CDS01 [Fusarium sp. VM40]|nr:Ff.00g127840.m01.CDS01 [Fusarium sp. VM40]